MVSVVVTTRVTVIVFGVADFKNTNSHRDGAYLANGREKAIHNTGRREMYVAEQNKNQCSTATGFGYVYIGVAWQPASAGSIAMMLRLAG